MKLDPRVIEGWCNIQAFQKVEEVLRFEVSNLLVSGHRQTIHGSYSHMPIKSYFLTCT